MDSTCTVVRCKEESENDQAIIVRFSNGILNKTEQLDFSFYRNIDEVNPRKKLRRLLVAESDRLSYVANNFTTGSLKCNHLCNYYVGVLNRQTMTMELHSAQLFNMKPVIQGEKTEGEEPQDKTQTYREKVDSLIEAFGTNKQKRALTSRRLNQVGSETLHTAVSQAANSVIEDKGLEVLQQEVAQLESQSDVSEYLPPCNPNADSPEDVYRFEDILSPVEYDALDAAGSKMAALSPEDLQNLRDKGGYLSVVHHLETLPRDGLEREKKACCAFYLYMLLKLAQQKQTGRKFGQEDGCPRIIQTKLMRTFTVETFINGRVQNKVSTTMQTKLAAYCLTLLLHIGDMTADITLLHRDLGMTEKRILELAKSMGLTLTRPGRGQEAPADQGGAHRVASLELPLVKYQVFSETRKRKKMH
ncbi:hypothetical protein UPYG_G00049410 [Umbra pygmaea]|uniref:DNA-directed RNA polymerase I subunit RPA49 n=1 Tax=Umbra pygmaea TaxID=75934 RepID=A0ABD0XRJ2_UMBPY